MTVEIPPVHVLVQDLDGDRVEWWREDVGIEPALTVMDLRVPPHRGAVWIARHWVTDRAEQSGAAPEARLDIALLTSELVGNVVSHGSGGEVEVRFIALDSQVTIEVSDSSPLTPLLRGLDPEGLGGRGIQLVDLLATAWGYRARPEHLGKTVWFAIGP
jgi:anti-sigma regulatory factor (Ser/Thr protein kinase)